MIRLWTLGSVALTDRHDVPLDAVAVQSKRIAILAYLALAEPRGWQRRDTVLGLFWPALDQERGRHALRQSLHFLRRHLGRDVIRTRGTEDIAVGPDLWCDAVAFAETREPGEALALYRGDLLTGFYVRDVAPEFEHWLDQRRAGLRARALSQCAALSDRRRSAGDAAGAVEWARRAVSVAPYDDGAARLLAERQREERAAPPTPTPPAAPRVEPARPARRPIWRRAGIATLALALGAAVFAPEINPTRAAAHSALADSLYTKGLVTLEDRSDARAALGWFEAAVQASPRFAMAAYYAGVSASGFDNGSAERWFARAAQLAPKAPAHDRLVIETALAFRADNPVALATADSLASRYPGDPLGTHLLGATLLWSGDFPAALRAFRRERRLLPPRPGGGCPTCEALDGEAVALQFLDSLRDAERVAREEVRRAPRSTQAWSTLAIIEGGLEHFAEARAARHRVSELTPGQPGDALGPAEYSLREGDFATADRLIRSAWEIGTVAGRTDALWMRIISLRNQGRLAEALSAARLYRRQFPDSIAPGLEAVPEAQVWFELGEFRRAAALFDSIGRAPGVRAGARARCWALTHAGEAWAAAGDTTRVLRLADSIAGEAVHSLYGRDRHLPDHLRGLVWLARGRPDSAFAHFAAAVYSPTNGYSRTNLELARLLLAGGEPREAAVMARAGLAGAIDGSAYYVTRTELHELAAQALDAAGDRDGARAEYEQVVRAWKTADARFTPRLRAARSRLASLAPQERRGLD